MLAFLLISTSLWALNWQESVADAQRLCLDEEYEASIALLEEVIKEVRLPSGTLTFLKLELADIYFDKLEDLVTAESLYRDVLASGPKTKGLGDVWYRLGLTLERQERFKEAAQAYEMAFKNCPDAKFAEDAQKGFSACSLKIYSELAAQIDGFPITSAEVKSRMGRDSIGSKDALSQLIDERLFYCEALNKGLITYPELQKRLKSERTSLCYRYLYNQRVEEKAKVSEAEAYQYYQDHPDEFIEPEAVKAKAIFVKSREDVKEVLDQLKDHKPFPLLAERYSLWPSAAKGGDLGYFARGTYPETLETVVFNMELGEVSVIPALDGFVILRAEGRRPERKLSIYEAEFDITNKLFRERVKRFKEAWIIDLKKRADICYLPDNHDTLALVNSHPITRSSLEEKIASTSGPSRKDVQEILEESIIERLIVEEVEREKVFLHYSIQRELKELRRSLLDIMLRAVMIGPIINITEAELKRCYEENRAEFEAPEWLWAKEIVVGNKPMADSILGLLKEGASFDSLARVHSIASSRYRYGDMGRFQLETKPEEIKRAISQLRPGEVSEVVNTPLGYTIIKLERRSGGLKSFDEVRGMIRQRLFKEKEKAPLDALKNRLRSRAEIQIFLTYEAESP